MKVCIVGAGSIGGYLGTRLALSGAAEVSALARGATLEALRTQGWRVREGGELLQAPARAAASAAELGEQDLVVIAVKAPALAAVVPGLAKLLGPHTVVMPAMNGVPWWFLQGHAEDAALDSVDPGGAVARAIAFERVVGCVVHISASAPEPGLVLHKHARGLIVGEAAGGKSGRVQRITDLLIAAGFDATHSADVRYDIWYKLWGNLTTNPVSALTGATVDRILADPELRAFTSRAMLEAREVGARIGCAIAQSPEDRHAITAKLGAFKTSMLQDVEAGRPIELDGIVTVVHEIGRRVGVPTPSIDALLGLARVFARVHGLYPEA